jgi:hypothetical protein
LDTKNAGMDFGLCMTLDTLGRRSGKYLILVTLCALQVSMSTIQREEAGVVEIAHPVNAVMALQAIRAKLREVFFQESYTTVCGDMTGDATLLVDIF